MFPNYVSKLTITFINTSRLTFELLEGQRRQKISIYLWTSSCKSPLYMFWSGSRWNNLKQRQKPIISVDINVIKLVRKSMCAIFVSLKEKFCELFNFCRLDGVLRWKSKPDVSLPPSISVLFRYEILPTDSENDLESNELWINIAR